MQPLGQPHELGRLPAVGFRVRVRVVPDQHLREVGIELEDVVAEVLAVLEIEHVLARLLHRHGQLEAPLAGLGGDVATELLVDQHADRLRIDAPALNRRDHALEDQMLGVGDRLGLLGSGVALDPEHLLLEGPPVVEREDVQLAVVAQVH